MKISEYVHLSKGSMNHGLTSGEVSTGELYFTKDYIFLLPFHNAGMQGTIAQTTKFTNAKEFANDLKSQLDKISVNEFEERLKQFVGEKYYFKISELEKISVQVGWWIFGGMRIKNKSNGLMSINVQPKLVREQVKQFYNL